MQGSPSAWAGNPRGGRIGAQNGAGLLLDVYGHKIGNRFGL